jgi:hypothetical protein
MVRKNIMPVTTPHGGQEAKRRDPEKVAANKIYLCKAYPQ